MVKMIITMDEATDTIKAVELEKDGKLSEFKKSAGVPTATDGVYRLIGTLIAYKGSTCITINLPGGGSYQICF